MNFNLMQFSDRSYLLSVAKQQFLAMNKKSKDVFIPLNNVINNSFSKKQNSDSSIALNSTDSNTDYASFENQFLNSIG